MGNLNDIIKLDDGTYKAFVGNPEACNRLNRRLRQYPDMPDFVTEGSEGVFSFTEADYAFVRAALALTQNN